mmetsp:Transcript_21826/g.88888  ORF Transcript_21826/g.88888 Transcript_21826/m.88888 type:complete len:107 (-) Transcript_21826:1803-2123(-)
MSVLRDGAKFGVDAVSGILEDGYLDLVLKGLTILAAFVVWCAVLEQVRFYRHGSSQFPGPIAVIPFVNSLLEMVLLLPSRRSTRVGVGLDVVLSLSNPSSRSSPWL